MLNALTLPALVALIGIPGFGFKKPPAPAPGDTLPPPWKSASRLALENDFVLGSLPPLRRSPGPGVRLSFDPRRLEVGFDPAAGTLRTAAELGDIPLGASSRAPLAEFSRDLSRRSFEKVWRERSRQSINSLGANTPQQRSQGLSFQLPSPLPRRVQSWLGPGGPAINVSGSENIRLSGTSNWTNQQQGLLGQKRSLFPSLDMQQDLDIRLEGQLSDRIKVNLLQNSANQIPLANRIAINYRGDEDDLVQALDLGNTNLTLPGTQFVSYSGKNEGLFGAKLATRVGPLDWTVLASKQEGRSERASYGGGAASAKQTLFDVDWVRGQYFLLYDPNLAPTLDILETSIRVYVDDNNAYNDATGTVAGRAYVDPVGLNGVTNDTTSVLGQFAIKNPGADQDYEILSNLYGPYYKVLRLRQPLQGDQRLAVSFLGRFAGGGPADTVRVGGDTDPDGRLRLKLLRAPANAYGPASQDRGALYDATRPIDIVRELELKNVYQLGGSRIDPKSFRLQIRRGVDDPPVTSYRLGETTIPFIEVLGLDNRDEKGGSPVPGHDGEVDGTALRDLDNVALVPFVDYENGLLYLRDPRPFAPRLLGGDAKRFDQAVSRTLLRRDSLVGGAGAPNEPNRAAYDKYNVFRNEDAVYYIDVEYTAARAGGEIPLGRGNLLEGSEVVTVNGQAWVRDRDYRIDYDLGRITLIKQLGPADNLNVDYSYAPLFQQAGRTLVGSAFRLEGRDKALGGAFMYESRGAQDLRPRLGEEPSRSVIGDLNTDWTLRPGWVTRLADRLPGVRTTQPSEMRVQAEVGMSFPNPNTRNEVFIDDMEGVRDAVSLSMGPERWRWGSVPSRRSSGLVRSLIADTTAFGRQRNAEVHWYSPPAAVKEWHLKPTLTQAQGADNSRQALAISVPRRPKSARNPDAFPSGYDTLWTSLTYPLDPVGLDLSRSQFIELWVNDFNDQHGRFPVPRVRGRGLKLHIEIGKVSEDQMRAPDAPPNDTLDTEDRNTDNQLSATSTDNEDTGYDGRLSPRFVKNATDPSEAAARVLDLATAGPDDPTGDDFRTTDANFKDELDPRRYRFTNGVEDNKNLNPNPDTEDLNLNGILDTQEDYWQYTIDLGEADSPYLVTDVRRDFAGKPTYKIIPDDNGWRRYRIPLSDSLRVAFGLPDLTRAQHVRVWVEGIVNVDPDESVTDSLFVGEQGPTVRPLLMLGSLDIVGSRWQAQDLPARMDSSGTTLTLNSVNTVDNADVYVPPFDPGQTRSGNQGLQRREQSIALEFTELAPGDTLEAYKTFSIDENYSRYGKLDWFAAGFDIPGYDAAVDTLWYFMRFASDEAGRNYYEYRARVPRGSTAGAIDWARVSLPLIALSNLKLDLAFPKVDPILYRVPQPDGTEYVIRGRPSFTRLRRISFGLINGGRKWSRGQLWIDELRATDVARDVGRAQRLTVAGNVANLLQYNAAWNARDADFLSVGETRGMGSSQDQLNLGGTVQLHRFFEGTGILLPFSYGYARSSSKPRFTAGDDVVRTGALEAASETRSETRSWSTSYSRAWSERSNRLLRYTVGGITANLARTETDGRSPTNVDARNSLNAAVGWTIAPRNLWSLGLPRTRSKLYLLPERVYWNYSLQKTEGRTFDRLRDSTGSLVLRNETKGRVATIDFGMDSRPIDAFRHFFKGTRNLTLDEPLRERIGFINLGRVVQWSQGMDASYSLNRGTWLRPRLSWGTGYSQNNGPELSRDLSVRSVANNQTARVSWELPFERLRSRAAPAPVPVAARADTGAAKPAPPKRPPFRFGDLVGRLGTLTTDGSVTQTSAYSRLTGTPNLLYLMGLSNDPGLSGDSTGAVRALFGSQASKGLQWSTSARSRLDIGFGAGLTTRGEMSSRRSELNAVVTRSTSARFPDVEVDYGRIPTVLRLDRFFSNPRLRTSFNRSRLSEFQNESRTSRSTSTEWRPLLGFNGDLKNGTRTELRVERRGTQRENFQLGRSVTEETNTDVNLNVNRSYTQGQKVNVLGKETTVRSTIQLGFSGAYSRRQSETRRGDSPRTLFPVLEDRLSVRGTGSYGFSNNVTGNAALGFLQTNDYQRDIVRRSITVELRAQFTF